MRVQQTRKNYKRVKKTDKSSAFKETRLIKEKQPISDQKNLSSQIILKGPPTPSVFILRYDVCPKEEKK